MGAGLNVVKRLGWHRRHTITTKDTAMEWPNVDCCSPGMPCCICPMEERALRGWKRGFPGIPKMTEHQREYCLSEIDQIEGYSREEHEHDDDSALASTVLAAWTDFARDKGLL